MLDGSRGASGVVSGQNLEFVRATSDTQTSGPRGYDVHITQVATRAQVTGTIALTADIINKGTQITINENSKSMNFTTLKGETIEANLNALEKSMKDSGLAVELVRPDQVNTGANQAQYISLRHREFGSEHEFSVASSEADLTGASKDTYNTVNNGLDVDGRSMEKKHMELGKFFMAKMVMQIPRG